MGPSHNLRETWPSYKRTHNSLVVAHMYQAIGSDFRSLGGRRKDDVIVIVIVALLSLLFLTQLAWFIAGKPHP